jgi:dihydrofolate reductase
MTLVFTALATSVDGYITGPNPGPELPSGERGAQLFDWYTDGTTASREFADFRSDAASAPVFDAIATRAGAVVAGRRTYDHSHGWGGNGPHPTAPLYVLTHSRPAGAGEAQSFVASGIEEALARAKEAAAGKDVALMGSYMVSEALRAHPLDEVIVHQVPVLLGGGGPLFRNLAAAVQLERCRSGRLDRGLTAP